METSLRYGGDSKALRIHAKEKFPVDSNILFQAHGELDTKSGSPGCLALLIRYFYPELSSSIGVGFQFNNQDKFRYTLHAKKAFPFTSDGLLSFKIKGRCDVDKEFAERRPRGALELSWGILNFQRDQDVRLKVGYEIFQKVPYFQLRENNWTLNADINGRWNVILLRFFDEFLFDTYTNYFKEWHSSEKSISGQKPSGLAYHVNL